MKPELFTFCHEDTREQIVGALAEAAVMGLERPTEAERLRRYVLAVQLLAKSANVSHRKMAVEYAKQMKPLNQ